jgi:hypothetical protein
MRTLIGYVRYENLSATTDKQKADLLFVLRLPNIFLKKLPISFVEILLKLCNLAYSVGLPKKWRLAEITMIPKTAGKSKEPSDYRPISMTRKLAERLVKTRLYSHLEINNLIVIQQSV